jgi:hypothetical protein
MCQGRGPLSRGPMLVTLRLLSTGLPQVVGPLPSKVRDRAEHADDTSSSPR